MNNMAALQEIDRLLRATPTQLLPRVIRGEVVPVTRLNGDAKLVYGLFSYSGRNVEDPNRPLTFLLTRQPIFAVSEGGRYTPLAYAEDVVEHPLRNAIVGQLETIKGK